jgi:ketosteroid isomerase-like protein
MIDVDLLARAVVATLETGDDAELLGALAPGAVTWHNNDRKEVDARINSSRAAAMLRMLRDPRVEVARVAGFGDGAVMQYVLRATLVSTGETIEMHNCAVMSCDDRGRVTRIDEYVDTTALAAFARAMPPQS